MEAYSGSGAKPPVVINSVALPPMEVNGDRVITLAMVDRVHGRPEGTARRTFNANRARMVEGKHHFVRNSSEAAALGITAPNGLIVLTERGYLMLVKSFTDDLAWQVQDALVESYFIKAPVIRIANPNTAAVRECRLTHAMNMKMLAMLGIKGNQAVIAASRGTKALTGIDPLAVMGISHIDAPQNEALLTPTEIGKRIGMSGREVNSRLNALGLQQPFRDAKAHLYYEPTDAGKEAGATMQDTGKKHGNGVPVRQLKWPSSVCDTIRDDDTTH